MAATSSAPSWLRGKLIGRGSYGTVSLALHRESGSVFAVKSVPLHSHPDLIHSLDNEIRILSSLDYSPYIVRYLGNDFDASHRNLHLELLPGGTIAQEAAAARRRDNMKSFDEGAVRLHARCLVSALWHVHSRGIVHCDVKGSNVIVGRDPAVAKLADFGSAVRVGTTGKGTRGSPLWMAPEVVRGEYQGPESDVWSLGCTVIEMVTGRPAWEDRGAETLSLIGLSGSLPEFPSELSAQGRDFLDKCLRINPEERWSCDRLLRHPFLAPDTAAVLSRVDSSPRCVLDWLESEFDETEESESGCLSPSSPEGTEAESRATGRVRELCGGGGAATWEWEEEGGWVVVREESSSPSPSPSHRRLNWVAREEGCRREYSDSEESRVAEREYCETWGIGWENGRRKPAEYLNGWPATARWRTSSPSGTGGDREQVAEGKWWCMGSTGATLTMASDHCCFYSLVEAEAEAEEEEEAVVVAADRDRCKKHLLLLLLSNCYLLMTLLLATWNYINDFIKGMMTFIVHEHVVPSLVCCVPFFCGVGLAPLTVSRVGISYRVINEEELGDRINSNILIGQISRASSHNQSAASAS